NEFGEPCAASFLVKGVVIVRPRGNPYWPTISPPTKVVVATNAKMRWFIANSVRLFWEEQGAHATGVRPTCDRDFSVQARICPFQPPPPVQRLVMKVTVSTALTPLAFNTRTRAVRLSSSP